MDRITEKALEGILNVAKKNTEGIISINNAIIGLLDRIKKLEKEVIEFKKS